MKLPKKVQSFEREPGGYAVSTAYGFAFDPDPDHNSACHFHFYPTAAEARAEFRDIRPCACLRCTSKGKLA